ncbi:MAG: DHH family phosphoesterase [Deltaproteobacteria bacterium]|nr:DHH family phosphoesterase [Deltaproteobacteria bacterium]
MLWQTIKIDERATAALAKKVGFSRILSRMLLRRQMADPEVIQAFLNPSLRDLPNPGLLPDMNQAADHILKAIDQNQTITVFGDYDADGLTATSLLAEFLTTLGGRVTTYIPHRLEEGYGLNPPAVERLAAAGTKLIITVDCGSSDLSAVNRARELGVEVIITDHHKVPAHLPTALAVVNPQRSGSKFPQSELAGVGVAFFLAYEKKEWIKPAHCRNWLPFSAWWPSAP